MAIVSFFTSTPCYLFSPPLLKQKQKPLSSITTRNFFSTTVRLSWIGGEKRMPYFALLSSKSNQQPEESEVSDLSDEAFLPPDDADYLWKLLAGSVGGGAVVKYGSIPFPDITRPNLAQALLMVSLPVLVAAILLIKESYSSSNEDLF